MNTYVWDGSQTVESGATYRFRGASSVWNWPRSNGLRLGACGMWNFLWRLGFHPRRIENQKLPPPANGDLLLLQLDGPADRGVLERIRKWLGLGGKLAVAGHPDGWTSLGLDERRWQSAKPENPYTGLAYVIRDRNVSLIAPTGWTFGRCDGPSQADVGVLALI